MMKFLMVLLVLLVSSHDLLAQNITRDEVRQMMESRDRQIKQLVGPEGTAHTDTQREQLKDIINGIIDYTAMARIALQSTFDEITPAQRTEFVTLFSSIIRDQSLNNMDIYRAQVAYDGITISGNSAIVNTTATLKDVRTTVSYSIEKRGSGWFITDMAIDNVSTAESYRRSFQNMIRRRGFDALLENLRRRADA
jgi:phospholipid transport system substrate-binding protein